MGSAHSKWHVDVDSPAADVSIHGASNGVQLHPVLEVVDAVPKDAAAEPSVTMTEATQFFASVPEKDGVKTVMLAAASFAVHDAKRDVASNQKLSHESDTSKKFEFDLRS